MPDELKLDPLDITLGEVKSELRDLLQPGSRVRWTHVDTRRELTLASARIPAKLPPGRYIITVLGPDGGVQASLATVVEEEEPATRVSEGDTQSHAGADDTRQIIREFREEMKAMREDMKEERARIRAEAFETVEQQIKVLTAAAKLQDVADRRETRGRLSEMKMEVELSREKRLAEQQRRSDDREDLVAIRKYGLKEDPPKDQPGPFGALGEVIEKNVGSEGVNIIRKVVIPAIVKYTAGEKAAATFSHAQAQLDAADRNQNLKESNNVRTTTGGFAAARERLMAGHRRIDAARRSAGLA